MLSEKAQRVLASLSHREDASRKICLIPLGSIHWADELPDFRVMVTLTEEDQREIYRTFGLRMKLWNGEQLGEADQRAWEGMKEQAPDWPLFKRLQLSEQDQRERRQIEAQSLGALESFLASADSVTLDPLEDGIQKWSATFDLSDEKKTEATFLQRLWKQLKRK
jgi:hypothetical protein